MNYLDGETMIPSEAEIMRNWCDADVPLVSIKCLVYNHENYVSQALDGFLMQKTTFPFEVVIHDDASTDGSARIIKEYEAKYPHIIKPIYETENQYSKHDGSLSRAINPLLRGKYIALCEGDDYWIDENKLHLQVNFLERNPECGLTYAKVKMFFQDTQTYGDEFGKNISSIKQLIREGNCIPTCSVLFRKQLHDKYISEINPDEKKWLMGDYPMNLWFLCNSKIKYMSQVIGVYRVLRKSASHSDDLNRLICFSESTNDILKYFQDFYNLKVKLPDHVMLTKFIYYLSKNDRKNVIENAVFSKLTKQTGIIKLKVLIFKNDFLYKIYKVIRHK